MKRDTHIIDYIFTECLGWDTPPEYYLKDGRLIFPFDFHLVDIVVGSIVGFPDEMLWWINGNLLCVEYDALEEIVNDIYLFVDYLNAADIKVEELEEVQS